MKKSLLLVSIAALALAGCKKVPVADVTGDWNTTGFTVKGVAQPVTESDISFTKSGSNTFTVSGNSGVNFFNGTVDIANEKFSSSENMASTKMAGSPEAEDFENKFLQTLCDADSIEVSEADGVKVLKITDNDTASVLTFTKKEENN